MKTYFWSPTVLAALLLTGCDTGQTTAPPPSSAEPAPTTPDAADDADAREAGREVGETARDISREAREIGREISEEAKEFGRGVKEGFKQDETPK